MWRNLGDANYRALLHVKLLSKNIMYQTLNVNNTFKANQPLQTKARISNFRHWNWAVLRVKRILCLFSVVCCLCPYVWFPVQRVGMASVSTISMPVASHLVDYNATHSTTRRCSNMRLGFKTYQCLHFTYYKSIILYLWFYFTWNILWEWITVENTSINPKYELHVKWNISENIIT